MWVNEVAPERLAELFHHYHQALMPEIGGKGEKSGTWTEVPQQEKSRLVAAARLALQERIPQPANGKHRGNILPSPAKQSGAAR